MPHLSAFGLTERDYNLMLQDNDDDIETAKGSSLIMA